MIRASQELRPVTHAVAISSESALQSRCGLPVKGAKPHHRFAFKAAAVTCTECIRRIFDVQVEA